MTSAIDASKPTAGTATTSSVRANFSAAYDEINTLQRGSSGYATTSGTGTYTVAFTNPLPSLSDGARISVEIGSTNTGAATLAVDGLAAVSIVKKDGSTALSAGDLAAGEIADLLYNGTNWVWLNSVGDSVALTGTPTAPTATQGDDSTQIATTAFVAGQGVLQIDETDGDPSNTTDVTKIYSETASGNLAAIFGNGAVRTLANDDTTADNLTASQGSAWVGPLLIQWGLETLTTTGNNTITFDRAFPNVCANVQVTRNDTGVSIPYAVSDVTPPTTTQFVIDPEDTAALTGVYYLAIGW